VELRDFWPNRPVFQVLSPFFPTVSGIRDHRRGENTGRKRGENRALTLFRVSSRHTRGYARACPFAVQNSPYWSTLVHSRPNLDSVDGIGPPCRPSGPAAGIFAERPRTPVNKFAAFLPGRPSPSAKLRGRG
jgi:hypothetical protein